MKTYETQYNLFLQIKTQNQSMYNKSKFLKYYLKATSYINDAVIDKQSSTN